MSDDLLEDDVKPVKVKRRKNGTIAKGHSLNPSGRPVGSTNKINKQKVVAAVNKNLLKALERIMKISDVAFEKGELNTSLKAAATYASEGLKLLQSQEKIATELAKIANKEDKQEEDTPELEEAIFEFTKFNGTDN